MSDTPDLGPYKPGRPRKYETVEQMETVIDEYFDYCDNRIRSVYSKKADDVIELIDPAPYTMSGLALALGMDRSALLDYKKRKDSNGKDYLPTIKAARRRVEANLDERMNDKETFTPGIIFNMKNNFGYKDKSEVDGTQKLIVETRKHSRGKVKAAVTSEDEDDTDDDQD